MRPGVTIATHCGMAQRLPPGLLRVSPAPGLDSVSVVDGYYSYITSGSSPLRIRRVISTFLFSRFAALSAFFFLRLLDDLLLPAPLGP